MLETVFQTTRSHNQATDNRQDSNRFLAHILASEVFSSSIPGTQPPCLGLSVLRENETRISATLVNFVFHLTVLICKTEGFKYHQIQLMYVIHFIAANCEDRIRSSSGH